MNVRALRPLWVSAAACAVIGCAAHDIRWEPDLATAHAASERDGKPVLLYFTYKDSDWSRRLEAGPLSHSDVLDEARAFHWVRIDRDADPETSRHMNIITYPTLVVVGQGDDEIDRISGYRPAEGLLERLAEARERFSRYRKGQPWEEEAARPERIVDGEAADVLPAPSERLPAGMCWLNGSLWVGQGDSLRRLDPQDGRVLAVFPLPGGIRDICTDGSVLYALPLRWTEGRPLLEIAPADGRIRREIETPQKSTNWSLGASGITWLDGDLWVLNGARGRIACLDPVSGMVRRELEVRPRWLASLTVVEDRLVAAGTDGIYSIDAQTGESSLEAKTYFPARVLTWHDGTWYLMEQPRYAHDRNHRLVRIQPKKMVIYRVKGITKRVKSE